MVAYPFEIIINSSAKMHDSLKKTLRGSPFGQAHESVISSFVSRLRYSLAPLHRSNLDFILISRRFVAGVCA